MKIFIRNKLISLGGSSVVTNEDNEEIFKVKGKVFSPTKKKFIYDMSGNLLYIVRNKWWRVFVHKAYIMDANKERVATVKDSWRSLKGTYYVEDYADEISIEGKLFNFQSQIKRNGEVMADVTSQILRLEDNFTVFVDEKDVPFVVALIIALDNISDRKSKEKV